MNHSGFEVIPYKNRNGSTSWRVVGWLHGDRIRKNFKNRREAAAEKATLEVQAAQTTQGMRMVATTLTAEQVRESRPRRKLKRFSTVCATDPARCRSTSISR